MTPVYCKVSFQKWEQGSEIWLCLTRYLQGEDTETFLRRPRTGSGGCGEGVPWCRDLCPTKKALALQLFPSQFCITHSPKEQELCSPLHGQLLGATETKNDLVQSQY